MIVAVVGWFSFSGLSDICYLAVVAGDEEQYGRVVRYMVGACFSVNVNVIYGGALLLKTMIRQTPA